MTSLRQAGSRSKRASMRCRRRKYEVILFGLSMLLAGAVFSGVESMLLIVQSGFLSEHDDNQQQACENRPHGQDGVKRIDVMRIDQPNIKQATHNQADDRPGQQTLFRFVHMLNKLNSSTSRI